MTIEEIIELYHQFEVASRKEMTHIYNSLDVLDRIEYAEYLRNLPDNKMSFNNFKNDLSKQAIDDFWFHERELILEGKSTYNWTSEQIESILNIDSDTGIMNPNLAGRAFQIDENGNPIKDANNNYSYYGHHMLNVDEYPEYAGDWRNIQALNYDDHYYGAHPDHKTTIPTNWYYDSVTESYFLIDTTEYVDFDKIYSDRKVESIFKSDADMKLLYADYDKLNNGQQFSLKYIDSTAAKAA